MSRQGIDVSNWQGGVHWAAAAHDIDFAFCKVSEGRRINDTFWTKQRVKELRAAKIAFSGYHFALNTGHPKADAIAECRHFVERLKAAGWDHREAGTFFERLHAHGWAAAAGTSMPGVLDMEHGTFGRPGQRFVRQWVREYARLTGHLPIIYTGSFWRDALRNPIIATKCRLWLAAYVGDYKPYVPRAWKRPTFWQYTDKFRCAGVSAPCDGDKFLGHDKERKHKRHTRHHRSKH